MTLDGSRGNAKKGEKIKQSESVMEKKETFNT